MTIKKIIVWECQECYNIFKEKKQEAEQCCEKYSNELKQIEKNLEKLRKLR